MFTRRHFVGGLAALAGGRALAQSAAPAPAPAPGRAVPIETPNGVTATYKLVDGVKVFHLIAEEFDHVMAPGLKVRCWGYNGRTPGPTIEAVEGDRLRIYVTNRLPEPTTTHWHGILVPNGMDGVNGLTQKPIEPGATFKYEFTLHQYGTYMYHSHCDEMTQAGLGMMGMFIIHPREPEAEPPERDFAIMLSEWRIDPGAARPDPTEMTDFNVLTMNSVAYPGTAPLVVRQGQRVRIRLGNLSAMEHHPIHLHGHTFQITETDGGPVPVTARWPGNTVLVPVGSTRAVEFIADNPGDWAMHCHMTHHMMNQMGHNLPNVIGIKTGGLDRKMRALFPGYMTMGTNGMGESMQMSQPRNTIAMLGGDGPFGEIDMGGMFTILKVRPGIASYEDPGWYKHPSGTVSEPATAADLERDLGI
jgi:FtsP/CotA-like multicopper oxidase with cupredoxin domain